MGDQRHLVFECTALRQVRDNYPQLFDNNITQCMHRFMTQADEKSVMNFVVDCLDILEID